MSQPLSDEQLQICRHNFTSYNQTRLLMEIDRLHSLLKQPRKTELQPIETAPKNGEYIILFGDSGYIGTPLRAEVCRYDAVYRPLQPWVNYGGDSFLDSGSKPLFWTPLPVMTKKQATEIYRGLEYTLITIEECEKIPVEEEGNKNV